MSNTDFQEALDRLKQEFIDNSSERLDGIDAIIDRLYQELDDRDADYMAFQRDVHSIKGTAGTYGFGSVTMIAHRLEDYIEAVPRLNNDQLLHVQVYVDQIRGILEGGVEISSERLDQILASLPSNAAALQQHDGVHRAVVVLLVMPKGVQRKMLITELSSCGFELAFSDHPLEAFRLAVVLKPDLIVTSFEFDDLNGLELANAFRAVKAISKTPIVLLTSHSVEQMEGPVPDNMQVVSKGRDFAPELASKLMQFGLFGKVTKN